MVWRNQILERKHLVNGADIVITGAIVRFISGGLLLMPELLPVPRQQIIDPIEGMAVATSEDIRQQGWCI